MIPTHRAHAAQHDPLLPLPAPPVHVRHGPDAGRRYLAEIGVVERRGDGGLVVVTALDVDPAGGVRRGRGWPRLAARLDQAGPRGQCEQRDHGGDVGLVGQGVDGGQGADVGQGAQRGTLARVARERT